MDTKDFNKQIVDFNKNAAKIGFETMSAFSSQAAKLTDSLIAIMPNVPTEVKNGTDLLFKDQQKSLNNLQSYVDGQLNVDWTSETAPAKSVEVLEQFSKNVFAQAEVIKKESKKLADKTTEKLPKEALPLVGIWNDAINNGFSLFQDSLNKSLDLSKELLAKEAEKAKTAAK
ncbi:MAG TPA: hypothetical protein VKN62_11400 [Pelovirga sp.]|nr:hypothetical protein [Pelovirga sp.]